MKNIIKLSMLFLLFSSCSEHKLCESDKLSLQKTKYEGSELRIDGYYFGDINRVSNVPYASIYYLYNNGVFFTPATTDLDKAELGTINVDIENSFGKKVKSAWGLFKINNNLIEIEHWSPNFNGCESIIHDSGIILNDTVFVIKMRLHKENGKVTSTEYPNSTFYFRALEKKPDSTNVYIH